MKYKKNLFFALSGLCFLWGCGEKSDGAAEMEEYAMRAMVLTDPSGGLYFVDESGGLFTANVPETITDMDGKEISAENLGAGDTVEMYGNGIMLESYPGQYPGVTRVTLVDDGTEADALPYQYLIDEIYREPDPAEPPSMNLEYTDGSISTAVILLPGSYEWSYADENGEEQRVAACGPHILECEEISKVELDSPSDLRLLPSKEMESVTVARWPSQLRNGDESAGKEQGEAVEAAYENDAWVIRGVEPDYVYLITAFWKEGYVEFGFLAE